MGAGCSKAEAVSEPGLQDEDTVVSAKQDNGAATQGAKKLTHLQSAPLDLLAGPRLRV